ncbi:hypothetical protein DL96DRAFT_1722198 [Flagelloscypha sp. PMI_526]|nr:hypothetical protein DL96DRAFT_1722198 [Flagelloscypha sp. PMI_526]
MKFALLTVLVFGAFTAQAMPTLLDAIEPRNQIDAWSNNRKREALLDTDRAGKEASTWRGGKREPLLDTDRAGKEADAWRGGKREALFDN